MTGKFESIIDKLKGATLDINDAKNLFSSDEESLSGNYDEDFEKVMKKLDKKDVVCFDELTHNELSALRYRAKKRGFNISSTRKVVADDGGVCISIDEDSKDRFEDFVEKEL